MTQLGLATAEAPTGFEALPQRRGSTEQSEDLAGGRVRSDSNHVQPAHQFSQDLTRRTRTMPPFRFNEPMSSFKVPPRCPVPLIPRDVRLGHGCSFPPRQLAGVHVAYGGEHGWGTKTENASLDVHARQPAVTYTHYPYRVARHDAVHVVRGGRGAAERQGRYGAACSAMSRGMARPWKLPLAAQRGACVHRAGIEMLQPRHLYKTPLQLQDCHCKREDQEEDADVNRPPQ
jgi:hypothetical protein